MKFDVVVVGAGVIGLACARLLSEKRMSVLLIERHANFGREVSSRNSQVIHAGIYNPAGSLKARTCVAGNRALYAWCQRYGIAHRRTGKLIVATHPAEESELESLLACGLANGVEGLSPISGSQATQLEPALRVHSAIFSATSGIVDIHGLMASLLSLARDAGCDVAFRQTLLRVDAQANGYRLTLRSEAHKEESIDTRCVVNAAGLDSDTVAELAGLDVDALGYRLRYIKGHYFRLRSNRLSLRHLVYPVPAPDLIGLGIHATLGLDDTIRFGPDTLAIERAQPDYDVPESLRDHFQQAVSRYLPMIGVEDLLPDQAGIRPARVGLPTEEYPRDFMIREESQNGLPGWVNLIGIESPGLTAALPIAELAASYI